MRGDAQGEGMSGYINFKTIVIAIGVLTALIFIGSVFSRGVAFVLCALIGLGGMIYLEMSSRRRWERELVHRLHLMGGDYERLVRDVARNRNDTAQLKRNLADAGAMARGLGRDGGDTAENRMLRAIATELSKLGGPEPIPEDDGVAMPAMDLGPVAKKEDMTPTEEQSIGSQLTDAQVLQLVNVAVNHDRVDLFVQPIVTLPQRKVRFLETFSRIRIRPGVYLPAERYVPVAAKHDLLPVIDNLLLLRNLQMLRDQDAEHDAGRAYFCNITSLTLNDPKFMGDLVEFIAQHRDMAPRLIFEMSQRDLGSMNADVLPILSGLANLGCRFSMDQVKSLALDPVQLDNRFIRFVKVDTAILSRALKETGGLRRLKRLKADLDAQGIDLISEKIETERQLIELLDVEIDFGQGYLFGKPALYGEKT